MNREAIYSSLFATLSGAAGFVTTSRRLAHWSTVDATAQPALYMNQKHETATRQRGLPTKWELAVDVYIYCQAPDDLTSPAITLNRLLDALEAAMQPKGRDVLTNTLTLGGLAYEVRIDGKIETDEGTLGGQAVAIIPLAITPPT